MKRDWRAARAKVDQEGRCRVCGARNGLQAAHTIGRKYDDRRTGVVDPRDIVPLCAHDHAAFDQRRLDLLPYLTLDEQARAVEHVGIERARNRLAPLG